MWRDKPRLVIWPGSITGNRAYSLVQNRGIVLGMSRTEVPGIEPLDVWSETKTSLHWETTDMVKMQIYSRWCWDQFKQSSLTYVTSTFTLVLWTGTILWDSTTIQSYIDMRTREIAGRELSEWSIRFFRRCAWQLVTLFCHNYDFVPGFCLSLSTSTLPYSTPLHLCSAVHIA